MKFAKIVFWIAGIWGVLILGVLYFMANAIGRMAPPSITHPEYYFGFLGVAMAWQLAFFFIARDPLRFRPMMIPAIAEKLIYVASMVILYSGGLVKPETGMAAFPDLILAVMFTLAYAKTSPRTEHQ